MRVLYHDIVAAPPEAEAPPAARRVSFDELLATSEYITLHVPLDASTRGMIDRRGLAKMRPDAILINCARGPVVVEADVAEALDAGRLWGYGGDVFEDEPPAPDHPLIGRPDVMLTPHSAAQTVEGLRNMATWIAEDVLGVLRASPAEPGQRPQASSTRSAAASAILALLSIDTFMKRFRSTRRSLFQEPSPCCIPIAGRFWAQSLREAPQFEADRIVAQWDDARAGSSSA